VRAARWIPWLGGALTTLWVLFVAGPRPGLTPDAMSYLGAAESLVHQGSLREPFATWNAPDSTTPLTDYPAGFSLVLAPPIAAGVPGPRAAAWVEALSVGGAVGVASALAGSVSGELGALVTVVLLALMPALVDVSFMVVSEPLFLLLLSLTVAGMVRRPERPELSGLAAAGANLVRYAGVFLVAGAALWQAFQPGTWQSRLRRLAIAALPGVLFHLYWRVEGIVPGGGFAAGVYTGWPEALSEAWNTGASWLAPGLHGWVATLIAIVLLGAMATAWFRGGPLVAAAGLLSILYVGTLAFTKTFVIADLPFDFRMLLPLCFLLTLGTACSLGVQTGRGRVVAGLVVAMWGVMALTRDIREIHRTRIGGVDYETAEWQESGVAAWLRGPGQGMALYSNDPAGIWFTAGRPSRLLPRSGAPDSISAFRARFSAQPSALVAFEETFALESVEADSLAADLHLIPVATFKHGVVWMTAKSLGR